MISASKSEIQEIITGIRTNLTAYRNKVGGLYYAHGIVTPGYEESLNIEKLLTNLEEIITDKPFTDVKEFYEDK